MWKCVLLVFGYYQMVAQTFSSSTRTRICCHLSWGVGFKCDLKKVIERLLYISHLYLTIVRCSVRVYNVAVWGLLRPQTVKNGFITIMNCNITHFNVFTTQLVWYFCLNIFCLNLKKKKYYMFILNVYIK